MKLEIPMEVDLNGIDSVVDEIKCLQEYKLPENDDMVLVSLDDVVKILINHIEAKRKSEPQKMRGKWETDAYGAMDDGEYLITRCSVCGTAYEYGHDDRYCGFCGAAMEAQDEIN